MWDPVVCTSCFQASPTLSARKQSLNYTISISVVRFYLPLFQEKMECWDFCCPHALSHVTSASGPWRVSACCDLLPSPGCPGDEAPAQGPSHCSHIPFSHIPAGKGLTLGIRTGSSGAKGAGQRCISEPHDSQSGAGRSRRGSAPEGVRVRREAADAPPRA